MSELIDNSNKKKEILKGLILQLHEGEGTDSVKSQIKELMGDVPYGVVVEAEQELIAEGLPQEEVLHLCDLHGEALKGHISLEGMKIPPAGHPVHTFQRENLALQVEAKALLPILTELGSSDAKERTGELLMRVRAGFNALSDVDKHYRRKENLVFPYLEKYGVTGPPTVMWGKHDQTRAQMKAAHEALAQMDAATPDELFTVVELVLKPALTGIEEMIYKEEQILFPMCLDRLTDVEWYEIYRQSPEIGFCLYDPIVAWEPAEGVMEQAEVKGSERIQLPSGSFSIPELMAVLNTASVDMTFVDKDDTVRFFTQGKERIFDRNRAILGRKVQMCHPPSSVHVVNQIIEDFRSGKQENAAFWITLGGKFIHIEYFALRGTDGEYLGTLEVSQDLTGKRALTGEQRLLEYETPGKEN